MNKDVLNTVILAASFLLLFATAEFLYHVLKIKAEFTRKFVHIGTGILTLYFPVMLNNHWLVLLLCVSFAVILILSLRFNLLKSINAIDRESVGSICYPVAVFVCYLAYEYSHLQYIYYYLPILILAICDPIAALVGKRWPIGKYKIGKDTKTLMGSGMFFLTAFIITWYIASWSGRRIETSRFIFMGLIVAFISSITEALSRKGYDNITIPISVLMSLIIVEYVVF